MNPHPSIFPLLIKKYNAYSNGTGPREFYDYLANWGIARSQAKEIKTIIQRWIEEQGDAYTGDYFNDYE